MRPGVAFVRGTHVNYGFLVEDGQVTLIDSGYPRDVPALLTALAGARLTPNDIVGAVLTHGHTDHQGGVARLRALGARFPVYAHTAEVANVRRDVLEQVTVRRAGWNLLRPRVARWAISAASAGAFEDVAVRDVVGVGAGEVLDLPGSPRLIFTPGHTSGHCAVYGEASGVLFSGDALATGHPTLVQRGLSVLPHYFNEDVGLCAVSAEVLRGVECEWLLPGHGAPVRGRRLAGIV